MPDANTDVARRSFEALSRGDFDAAFADYHADAEWRTAADEPDCETYKGIDALRRLIAMLADPWENRFDGAVELEDFIPRGDWVVIPWRAVLHGRGSGLEIEAVETYAVLVRDGKIARVDEYRTTREALEAVEAGE
jgi:ketosteroid isomerase-like protein